MLSRSDFNPLQPVGAAVKIDDIAGNGLGHARLTRFDEAICHERLCNNGIADNAFLDLRFSADRT